MTHSLRLKPHHSPSNIVAVCPPQARCVFLGGDFALGAIFLFDNAASCLRVCMYVRLGRKKKKKTSTVSRRIVCRLFLVKSASKMSRQDSGILRGVWGYFWKDVIPIVVLRIYAGTKRQVDLRITTKTKEGITYITARWSAVALLLNFICRYFVNGNACFHGSF